MAKYRNKGPAYRQLDGTVVPRGGEFEATDREHARFTRRRDPLFESLDGPRATRLGKAPKSAGAAIAAGATGDEALAYGRPAGAPTVVLGVPDPATPETSTHPGTATTRPAVVEPTGRRTKAADLAETPAARKSARGKAGRRPK